MTPNDANAKKSPCVIPYKNTIEKDKKAIVTCEDGNVFLSEHDGKGWIGSKGRRTNYFTDGYVVSYEYLE